MSGVGTPSLPRICNLNVQQLSALSTISQIRTLQTLGRGNKPNNYFVARLERNGITTNSKPKFTCGDSWPEKAGFFVDFSWRKSKTRINLVSSYLYVGNETVARYWIRSYRFTIKIQAHQADLSRVGTIAILINFLDLKNMKSLLGKEYNKTRERYFLKLRSDCYISLALY